MDTDNLSTETYNAVIKTSVQFNHDLTLQFGLLAEQCVDDNDYLITAKKLIDEWSEDLDLAHEDIFLGEPKPTKAELEKAIKKIETKINLVLVIPIINRKFEY